MNLIEIKGRQIGPGHPVYIIAEMSGNHRGDFHRAVDLISAAKEAGADAVKMQTYTADTLTLDSERPEFMVGGGTLWSGRRLHELYCEAATPWEWQPQLKAIAEEMGLHCFSSPFDSAAVEFLEAMDVPAWKIASFELVDIPLIERVARTGKPILMSTGMADLSEIDEAISAARTGGSSVGLFKCTSSYPARFEEMNLRTIPDMMSRFSVPVGVSDHSPGSTVPVAAVALGATMIEKHLTLRRRDGGPDAQFSMEPEEFRQMVASVRSTEAALGRVKYEVGERESASKAFRRSLFAVADIAKGQEFTYDNVRSIRPSNGLPPKFLSSIIGRKALCFIERGTPLSWEMIAGDPP